MATSRWIGTDGDLDVAGNWNPSGVPGAADNVVFPAGGGAITLNLDTFAAVALADVFVEPGAGAMGTILEYTSLNCDRLFYSGTAVSYLDFASSAPAELMIKQTASGGTGTFGLYLASASAVAEVAISDGSVSLGTSHAYDFTATTLGCGGSSNVVLGHDSTATTLYQNAGTFTNYGHISGNQYINAGEHYIESEQTQAGSYKVSGSGTVYHNGPGTAGGTVYLSSTGATWDATGAPGISRSVNWIQVTRGTLIFGSDYTVTNYSVSSLGIGPQKIVASILGE